MNQTLYDGETIDYELYPLITGAERLAALEEIRNSFTPKRAQELLTELAYIHGEFDRELPSIS